MSYDYNLQRFFKPPIDHLPVSEQLPYYRQRNLTHSHLYRFGQREIPTDVSFPRRRVIDASLYSPRHRVGHHALLQRSLDGQPQKGLTDNASKCQDYLYSEPSVLDVSANSSDLSETQYRKWTVDRRELRKSLDSVGANEKWLCSKERTPLENSILARLRNKSKELQFGKSTKSDVALPKVFMNSSKTSPTILPDPRKTLLNFKNQIIKEIVLIESHLARHRQRLVSLLAGTGDMHTRCIKVCDMLLILEKIKTPLSQETVEILLQVLDIQSDGHMDYYQLLNGRIMKAIEEHFKQLEANLHADDKIHHSLEKVSSDISAMSTMDLEKKYGAPSTLLGCAGTFVEDYKHEEVKQFSLLIDYCKENGIFLDCQVAEKALLIPPDKPQQDCLKELRQAGLTLLSRDFARTADKEPVTDEDSDISFKQFGRAYKEMRGQRKSVYLKLSTGGARVKAKTDCWLSFEEYMRLTERIRSKPGFKYKDHGLPDNNAFWPGVLLDKLRLWLPSMDKSCSLYSIFQPVTHPKIYNPYRPMIEQRTCWPENSSGYVQFGSQNRKQYHV